MLTSTLASFCTESSAAHIEAVASRFPTLAMPLQKVPSASLVVTDKSTSIDRNVLRERRRTLQTISELSPQGGTDWTDNSSKAHGNEFKETTTSRTSAKSTRRRSLPIQGIGAGYGYQNNSSILVTSTEALPLRRSVTDASGTKRNTTHRSSNGSLVDSHRLSRKSSSRCRHSQDAPLLSIAEGAQLDPRSHSHSVYSPPPYFKQNGSLAKQSTNGPVRHSEDWNARRERERVLREQAIVAAKARREKDRQSAVGSSSSLQCVSTLPTAKTKEIGSQNSQKHMLAHTQQISGNQSRVLLDQRPSCGLIPERVGGNYANHGLPRGTTSNGKDIPIAQRDMALRSHSVSSMPSWAYHANSTIGAIHHIASASPSQLLVTPFPQDQYQSSRTRSSSSVSPSPISTCSSNVSGVSHGTSQTQPSSLSLPSAGTRHKAELQVNNGRLEIFPALTDALPRPMTSQSATLNPTPKPRRYSQSSQNSRRKSLTQVPSHSKSQLQPHCSLAGYRSSLDMTGIIYRENPDKRDMPAVARMPSTSNVLKKREKVPRRQTEEEKSEAEKTAKEKARERAKERMRERVKRANELENEKEKELANAEMKKKKRQSLFCGLFGK
jgi:hypothetical protein